MARSTRKTSSKVGDTIPEADCRNGSIHPRLNTKVFGHEAAEKSILGAIKSGRMHHAWLIQGVNGIGKATFAYRIARFLLSVNNPEIAENLDVEKDNPAVRQIAAHGHPDLFVLRREWARERKRLRQSIAVDDVRKAITFFHRTSGAGGWRVAIVDSMDDLNRNGANALLKTLEEPPERALFLLVSNSPGALPATIRSRCRRLVLTPLNNIDMVSALSHGSRPNILDNLSDEARASLFGLAGGSPGQAIELATGNGLSINRDIQGILANLPKLDYGELHALAAKLGKPGAEGDFKLSMALLKDWISAQVSSHISNAKNGNYAQMAEAWEKIDRLTNTSDALNLDRRRTMLDAFNIVAAHYPV